MIDASDMTRAAQDKANMAVGVWKKAMAECQEAASGLQRAVAANAPPADGNAAFQRYLAAVAVEQVASTEAVLALLEANRALVAAAPG